MHNLPREQVRGVLAHELAHVKNRDVLVTTVAAMIGAAISAVANFLQFSWLFGGDDEDSPLGFVGTLAAILIAPIAAMILQLAVSRQREYLADATAAELMGEGRPLADALASLERGVQAVPIAVNPATASLYIANPLSGAGWRRSSRRIRRWRRGSSGCGSSIAARATSGSERGQAVGGVAVRADGRVARMLHGDARTAAR